MVPSTRKGCPSHMPTLSPRTDWDPREKAQSSPELTALGRIKSRRSLTMPTERPPTEYSLSSGASYCSNPNRPRQLKSNTGHPWCSLLTCSTSQAGVQETPLVMATVAPIYPTWTAGKAFGLNLSHPATIYWFARAGLSVPSSNLLCLSSI